MTHRGSPWLTLPAARRVGTQAGSWLLSPVDQEMLLQRAGVFLGLLCLPLGTQAGFRDRIQARNKKICKDRQLNQFFRKETETNCAKVVKCVADRGDLKLIPTACSPPLVFDIDSQICNYEEQVNNCDRQDKDPELEEDAERNILLEQAKAEKEEEGACDLSTCVLPSCFCSADGTQAPGGLELENIPQMINFAFNGAVNGENMAIYDRLFKKERVNPNGCQVKGTFFVSHKYTNYSAVQELHRQGHEIGVFSVTNTEDENYWKEGGYDTWYDEMAGARAIIEKWANITDGSVIGVRAPYLRVGGNTQFAMMNESYFPYDSSITAPLAAVPIWPYTLHHNIPHSCHSNNDALGGCPTEPFPLWELVINELDRREDPTFDEVTSYYKMKSFGVRAILPPSPGTNGLPIGEQLHKRAGEVPPEDAPRPQLPQALQDQQGPTLSLLQPLLAGAEPRLCRSDHGLDGFYPGHL